MRGPSYKADQTYIGKNKDKPNLPPKAPERNQGEPELHNDAPKRATSPRTAVIETEMVKGFHPEPYRGGGARWSEEGDDTRMHPHMSMPMQTQLKFGSDLGRN